MASSIQRVFDKTPATATASSFTTDTMEGNATSSTRRRLKSRQAGGDGQAPISRSPRPHEAQAIPFNLPTHNAVIVAADLR